MNIDELKYLMAMRRESWRRMQMTIAETKEWFIEAANYKHYSAEVARKTGHRSEYFQELY